MALIDKASLLMVPSVYEDGTLYNVLPSGNKAPDETGNNNGYDQTRADFTFSRGSNLSATRVNASGLIEKGRENLLLQSNAFDTTWSNVLSGSITSGQSGYDGTNNAWKLSKGATAYRYIIQSLSVSGVYSFSLYAKADTLNQVTIFNDTGGSNPYAKFSLVDGSVVASSGLIDSSATDAGNGWWRLSATFNNTITTARIYPDFAEADAGNIYIQNAQLEKSLVSTPYIETGSTTATAGVLENTPRIDYSSGAGALLLEPQRTNSIANSEYTDGSNWSNEGSITDEENTSETTSPEGLYNAVKLVSANATSEQWIQTTGVQTTNATDCTISCFVKKSDYDYFHIRFTGINGAFAAGSVWFNIAEGSVGTKQTGILADIKDYGNGWYRISATKEATATTTAGIRFQLASSDNNYNVAGDGVKGTYIYGCQAEIGSHVSSYVPTYGSAATRGAENLFVESLANELTTGYTSATLMIEFKYKQDSVGDAFVWGQDNNTYPAGRGYLYNKQSGFADSFGGGGFNDMSEDTTLKLIYRLNTLSNADVFLNGTKGTNVSGTAWSAINQIRFRGAYYTFEISQIAMYSEALTDAECVTLTTL